MQDAAAALKTLAQLKELGIRLSIDDFGTGYSSLIYLRRFPIDTLKIDRAFTHDMLTSADAKAIVEAIMGMSRALKLTVVAEGVEKEEQIAMLLARDCRYAQGLFFGMPVSAGEMTTLLQKWPCRDGGLGMHAA